MDVHFHFFEHFIQKFAEAQFTRYTFDRKMLDTVNITRQMERNAHLGISDLSEFIDNIYLIITRSQDSQLNYEMIQCPSCKAVGNRRTTC